MKQKLLHRADGQRTFVLVFDTGDEAVSGIRDVAKRERLQASQLTGIGAFSEVVLAPGRVGITHAQRERGSLSNDRLHGMLRIHLGLLALSDRRYKRRAIAVQSKRLGRLSAVEAAGRGRRNH
jgi:hypothetical protein